jgi:hypothetical protein
MPFWWTPERQRPDRHPIDTPQVEVPPRRVAPSIVVQVERRDGVVTLAVRGRLDANAGVELLATLQDEIDTGPARVDLDLQAVDDWTPEGARALRRARRLARVLDDGLHFRCAAGAGHDALLEAFAAEDDEDEVAAVDVPNGQ